MPLTSYILIILFGSVWVNLGYWILVFPKFMNREKININTDLEAVSIIISAQNESDNLKELIPLLLRQSYPIYEIIIVDDCSTDNTAEIIDSFTIGNPVVLIRNTIDKPGKKFALTLAINKAKYNWLLFTDADCKPKSSQKYWIRSMMSHRSDKSLTLGYGPMYKTKSFLNKYIRYETFLTAIQYFSYASWNHAYMGVGRNMLYNKSLFKQNMGFKSHEDTRSGDDDLFVNSMKDRSNVSICYAEESHMYSEAPKTIKEYYHQKTRHYSTSTQYRLEDKLALGLFAASHILIYISSLVLLILGIWKAVVIMYLLRLVLIMIFNIKSFNVLIISDLFLYFPLLDLMNFLFYLIFAPASFFPKNNKW